MSAERCVVWLLRFFGTTSLSAAFFVFVPSAWMNSIHASLGLGEMPDVPIVWYLARSTSAFYAMIGGLYWTISFDVVYYRKVVVYMGGAMFCLGVALLWIDWSSGLPAAWLFWEGPFAMAVGLTMNWLGRRLPS